MTDRSELKRQAETIKSQQDHLGMHRGMTVCPGVILELFAEIARLEGLQPAFPPRPPDGEGLPRYGLRWNGPQQPVAVAMDDGYWTPWHLADQLKADSERLARNRDMWKGQVERQAEELTRLRKALTECADSLHAEMLQKFGGQLPDDMHPVTRREYDRDMVEVAGYRAATAKADEDIPDFTPGNGNTARRRAEALGLDYDAALGMGERP